MTSESHTKRAKRMQGAAASADTEVPELKPSIELVTSQDAPRHESQSGRTTKSQKPIDKFIGTIIEDRFQILDCIGTGATTAVYRALDTQKQRTVALKVLRSEFADNEYTVLRFERECKTLKLLAHHNIVAYCYHGTTEDNRPYLIMEYLDGKSLKQLIESDAGVSPKRALKIFIQVCAALAAAHEKGVIHRDLKPANIMIQIDKEGNDVVKVLDFGVSKMLVQGETFQTKTQTGEMLGTLLYMSPEQCLDQDLDGRSDIYSLGCLMFETLTGTPPISARTAFETMNKHLTQAPAKLADVRPDLVWPAELETIVQKTLAKSAGDRPGGATALQRMLLNYQSRGDDVTVNRTYKPILPAEPVRHLNAPQLDSDSPETPALTVVLAPMLIGGVTLIVLAALVIAGLGHVETAFMVLLILGLPIAMLVLRDLGRS